MVKLWAFLLVIFIFGLISCTPQPSQKQETSVIFSRSDPGLVTYIHPKALKLSAIDASSAVISNGKIGIRVPAAGFASRKTHYIFLNNLHDAGSEEKLVPAIFEFGLTVPLGGDTLTKLIISNPIAKIDQKLVPAAQSLKTLITWVDGSKYEEMVTLGENQSVLISAKYSAKGFSGISRPVKFEIKGAKPIDISTGELFKVFSKSKPSQSSQILVQQDSNPVCIDFGVNTSKSNHPNSAIFQRQKFSQIKIVGSQDWENLLNYFADTLATSINKDSLPTGPMGLSNEIYSGHQFWDSDVWMLPTLKLTQPDIAKKISQYRLDRVEVAKLNYQNWVTSDRPIGKGKLSSTAISPPKGGIKFPWESGYSGKETVPGPSRFQDHISASVLFGMEQLNELGLISNQELAKVGTGVAKYYLSRIELAPNGHFDFNGTMSPDEHFTGNNDLYTNILVERILRRYADAPYNKLTANRARKGKQLLTYEGDSERGYKQAAAILAIWPLGDPESVAQASDMMTRFPVKVSKNGPAMSGAINATIFAKLNQPDKALAILNDEINTYCTRPFFLPSEKRSQARTVFLTGIAGYLNAFYYGFCGIEVVPMRPNLPKPYIPIVSSQNAVIFNPHFPKEWNNVSLEIRVEKKSYLVSFSPKGTNLKQLP